MLKVALFGTGQVRYGDRVLDGFPRRQCCLLLCYLLLNRHRLHHRERLAAVFWGDYPTAVSRKCLRNSLWRLHCALDSLGVRLADYLAIRDDTVAFLDSSPHWLDVECFESAVASCQDRPGQELTAEQAACLEQAVALYVGDLLEGIYEDWCLYDRERLRLLYLDALGKLLSFYEQQGAHESGLACGRRILALDPTREKVHRQVMRLYWLLGEQGEALAQYKCCAQVLHEELGIEPTDRTKTVYRQMLTNQFDPHAHPLILDPPDRNQQDPPDLPLLNQVLHRLLQLQAASEETRGELNQIVGLFKTVTGS